MESSLNFYQSDHQQSQQQQRRQESIDKNSANLNHNNHLKNLSKFNYDVGSNNNKQFRINKLSKITSIDSKGGNSNNNGSNSDRISRNDYYNNLTTSLPFKHHHHHHHQRKSFSTSPSSSSIFSKKTNTAAAAAAKFPFQSKKSTTTFHYQNVKDSIKNQSPSSSSSPSHYHHYSRQNPNSRFSSPTAATTTTNSSSSSSLSSSTQNLLQISSTLKNINNSSSNNKRQQQQDQKYNDNDDDDENLLDWLEAELDQRGIDSFIYSRYLLSLLQQYPPQQQQSTNDDDNLEDNLNEPDSGYEGSITTNNNFRFKQFLSAAATTTTGRPEKLRYCESHQRLYRGSPSLSSTTTTSSTSSSSSSSSSSSTQLNPFSLFNNRSSLKIQRPKNNQQKAPTTTKWMHKRYRQLTTDNKSQYNSSNGGRGRSMSNDRFNEQNDYNDDHNNNDDDDDFDDDLMLIDCPDCYRKYSRKKDYRKFMLSKCLKSAIDKDMMIKPTDFDEFIDEICQKFDQQQQHQTNDDDDDRHRKLLQFSSTNRNRQSNDNNNNGGKQQQEEKVKTTTELILDQAKRYYDAFPALGNESMIMTKSSSSSSSSTTSTLKSSSGSRSNSHSGSISRNKISISENFRSSQQSSFDDSVFIDNNNGQTLVDNNDNDDSWNGKKIIRNIVEKYQPKLNVISTNVEDFHHQQQQELQNQSTITASSSNSIQQQPQNLGKPLVVKLKSKLLGNNNKSRTGLIVTTSSTSNIDNIDNDNTNNNNNANININNNNNGDRMTTLKKLSTTINNNNNNNSIIVMNNNYNNNNNNDETINGKRMEMVKNSEHYDQQQQQQNQSILAENQILSATIKSITNHNNNNNTHSNHNSSSSTGLSAKEIEKINQLMPSYLMNQHSKTNLTQTTISTMTTTTTTTLPSTSTISVIKLKNDKNNKHYSSNQTMNRSINVQNVVIGEQQRKLSTLSSINHRSYSNAKRDFQSSNNGRKFQPYQKLSIISSADKHQDKIADNQIVDDQHDDEEKNGQSLTKNDGKSVDSLLPDFLKSTSVQQQQSPIKQKLSMAINDEKILENSILAKDDIENDNEKNVNENININSDDDDDGHTKMTVKCSSLKQLSPLFLLMDCQNVIDNDNQNDLLFNNVDDNNGQQNQQQQQQTLLINDCNIDNNSMKPLLSSFMMNDNNHMVNENDGNSLDDNIATSTTTSKTTLWKSKLMIYDDDHHIDKKHRNKDDDSDCHMEIITKKSSQSSIFANEDEELEEYIMSTTTTISPSSSSTTTKTTTSSSLLYETIDEWLDYHEKEFWPKSMAKIFQQFSNDNSGSDDNDETNWWQPIKSMLNDNIDCDNNKNHKEEESSTTKTTMMPEFWDHKRRMEWLTNLWNQNSTLGYMNDMFMMNSTNNNRQKNLNEELSLIIDLVQQQRQCQNQMTDNEKTTNSNEFNLTTIDSDGDVGGATIDSKLLNFYSFDDEMMQHFRKNFAEKMNNYHLNVNNNDNNSKCPNQIDKLDSKSEQNSLIDDNLLLPTTISSSSLSSSPSNDVINLTEMINNVLDSINRERQNEIEVDSNECFQTSLSIPIQSTGSSTSSLSSSFSNSDDLPSDFDVEKIPTSFLPKVQNNTTIESANVVEEIAPKPSGPFSKRYKLKSNANSADDNSKNDDNNYINGHVVTSNTNVDHSTFYSLRTSSYRHQQQNWYPTGSELQNDCSDYQGPHDDNIYYYGDDMDGGIMIDQNEATHFVESYGNDLYNYDGYLINMPKDDNNDLSMMNTNQLMSNNSFGKQNSFLTSSNDIDNLQPVDIKFKLENRYLVPDSDAKPVLKPCAFYLENACARLDCKFSHDLSSIPCKYYLEGACYKEEFCPFLHEKPKSDFDQIDSETLNSSTTSYMNFKSSQFKIESDSDFPSLFDEPKNTSSETNDNLFENQRVNFLYKTTTNLMKPAVVDARKSPLQSNDMKSNYEDSIPSSSSSSYIPNSSYSSQNFAKCFNATKTAKTSSSPLILPSPQQQLKIKVVEQPKQEEEEEWPSLSGSLEKSSSIDKNNSSNQTKKILNNNNSSLSTTKSSTLSLTSSSTTTTTSSLTTTNKVISLKNTNNRNNGSNFRDKVLMKSMSKKNKKNQLINNNNNNNDHQSLTATTKNTSSLKSIMKSF